MKKTTIPNSKELKEMLVKDMKRWVHIFNEGCSDPSYCDGVNINLVRNHILHDKAEIERNLQHNYMAYPDEYFYPDPIELPQTFMARDRKAPILAGFKNTGSDIVPAKRYGFTSLSQVFLFDWKE